MSFQRDFLEFGLRASDRIRREYFSWRFDVQARMFHKHLKVGHGNAFYVTVRADGEGSLEIGDRNSFGYRNAARIGSGEVLLQARQKEAILSIGSGNYISNNTSIIANDRITIENDCLIGDLVAICDSDFHEIAPARRRSGRGQCRPVHIGNNVWLGSRVMVLKGVSIGENTVVGAMSVVTKSLPANCIAAGIPAKVLGNLE